MTVHVIGAGLSGLATAWFLTERGARVRVIEAADRPGGLIHTERVPEGLIERAARAFTWTPAIEALFTGLDVAPVYARDQSKRRYIFRNGKPTRWPLTQFETLGAGARLLRAWAGRQMDARGTETVADWGARVLGPAATTWLLAPALQGIYAAPPEDLSASAIFGKDRPKGGKLAAPAGGMGELMDHLHRALQQRGVVFEFGNAADSNEIDASHPAVICTNAPAAARLLAPHAPQLAAALDRIRMVSMLAVHAFFAPHADDLHGFGVLFPRPSGVKALGAVFNAEVFPGRSELRSETWMYGDATEQMLRDRAMLTGRSDAPIASYVTQQPNALPVYDTAVLDARAALTDLPAHLAIAGNYLGRLGVSNLVAGAAEAAARIAGHSEGRT